MNVKKTLARRPARRRRRRLAGDRPQDADRLGQHRDRRVPRCIVAPGRVEPVRDPVALAFETGGRIVAIDVDEGDSVKAGQVVAHLDDRLAKARVAGAEAALAEAHARYDLARRGPRHEDLDAAKAEAAGRDRRGRAPRRPSKRGSEKLGAVGAIASCVGRCR